MLEYRIGQQEALLGLSLYVLACKSKLVVAFRQTTDVAYRRSGTHALGAIERD
jgi:uncharacterized membrane protein